MDEEEEEHEEGSTGQHQQNMEVAAAQGYQRRSLQNCPPDLKDFAERFKKQRIALGKISLCSSPKGKSLD